MNLVLRECGREYLVRWCRGSPIRPLAWPRPLSRVFNILIFCKTRRFKIWQTDKKYDKNQCCASALASMRIRIQHFWSMRIRIWIQGFDDQIFGKNLKLKHFSDQKMLFTYPKASIKDLQATEVVFIPQKRTSSTSKLDIFSFRGVFLPSWIWIQPTKMNADTAKTKLVY
jgi:hypothetical protein